MIQYCPSYAFAQCHFNGNRLEYLLSLCNGTIKGISTTVDNHSNKISHKNRRFNCRCTAYSHKQDTQGFHSKIIDRAPPKRRRNGANDGVVVFERIARFAAITHLF